MRSSPFSWCWIVGSFIIALLLMLFPFPSWLSFFQPQWGLLWLLYWCFAVPERIGIGTAFVAGLCFDVLYGTLFGQHTFALVFVAYFAIKWHQQIRLFTLSQQSLSVAIFAFVYSVLLYVIQVIQGLPIQQPWGYWISALMSCLLWPVVCFLLKFTKYSVP